MANRDNAPVPHTCPLIDGAISYIESIDWNMDEKDEIEKDLDYATRKIIELEQEIKSINESQATD